MEILAPKVESVHPGMHEAAATYVDGSGNCSPRMGYARGRRFSRRRPGPSLHTYVGRACGDLCIVRSVNASSWEVGAEMFGGVGWTDLVEMGRSVPPLFT